MHVVPLAVYLNHSKVFITLCVPSYSSFSQSCWSTLRRSHHVAKEDTFDTDWDALPAFYSERGWLWPLHRLMHATNFIAKFNPYKKKEKQATPKGVCQPKSNRVNSYDLCDINPVTRQHICWTKRVLPFPNGCTQSPVKPVLPHSAVSTTYGSNVYPARKKKKLKTFFLLKIKSLQQFYIAQHKALTSTHQSLKLSIYPI